MEHRSGYPYISPILSPHARFEENAEAGKNRLIRCAFVSASADGTDYALRLMNQPHG
ncbi:hypothetical protein HVZ60_04195 [Escherichia coli]|nr:hypothetical protein [Escherichia coli]